MGYLSHILIDDLREEIDIEELKERWEREIRRQERERRERRESPIGLSLKANPSKPTESNCDPTEKNQFF